MVHLGGDGAIGGGANFSFGGAIAPPSPPLEPPLYITLYNSPFPHSDQ